MRRSVRTSSHCAMQCARNTAQYFGNVGCCLSQLALRPVAFVLLNLLKLGWDVALGPLLSLLHALTRPLHAPLAGVIARFIFSLMEHDVIECDNKSYFCADCVKRWIVCDNR